MPKWPPINDMEFTTYEEEEVTFPPPLPPECGWFYTVRRGDTLRSIARLFGIPVQPIIESNPELSPPYVIRPGQKIILPVKVHTVTRGQTLYSIGDLYGFDWRNIARVNNIQPPYTIYPGQKLAIPGVTCTLPTPTCPGFLYKIKRGDTFYQLARRFGTSVDMLLKYNPEIDPQNLQIGQEICIPITAPEPDQQRFLILTSTETAPTAQGYVYLDYAKNFLIAILFDVPDPFEYGKEFNTYKVWLRSIEGYEDFSMYRTPQDVWVVRGYTDRPLKDYNALFISAEEETNVSQPAGTIIATGNLKRKA